MIHPLPLFRAPVILAIAAVLSSSAPKAQQTPAEAVAATRTTIEKYVETRGLVSKETRDWAVGKEALTARMDIVRREIESLQKRIADAEKTIADADRDRAELLAENERRKTVAEQLTAQVVTMEARVLKLLPRLPEPLRTRVKPLSQRLPVAGEENKQSVGERWQNVIGILNEVDKWNREITVTSEVRTLTDGSRVEVTVLYIGIGQAYYAGGNGKVAGIGSATASGWDWRQANELAGDIERAIKIYKSEDVAAFVRLPVQIQ
jgi:hypothetical protein